MILEMAQWIYKPNTKPEKDADKYKVLLYNYTKQNYFEKDKYANILPDMSLG